MATLSVGRPQSQLTHNERERIIQLAQPKISGLVWINPHSLKVQWGTQDTLWPISRKAMAANATSRMGTLATPKKNFRSDDIANRDEYLHSCGRGSIIWGVKPAALQASPSPRIEVLAQPKQMNKEFSEKQDRPNFVFSCGRDSPIWSSKGDGRSGGERPRTTELSKPRTLHPLYLTSKDVQTIVPRSAMAARASERVDVLSAPKNRSDGPFRDPMWPVSATAKKSEPSPRCLELARIKGVAEGYLPAREPIWLVTRAAKQASATNRLEELSKPIIRATMDHLQYDPEAFVVKETALKARISKRVEELSQPLTR